MQQAQQLGDNLMRLKQLRRRLLALAIVFATPAAMAATDAFTTQTASAALTTARELAPLYQKYGAQIAEYAKTLKPPEPGKPQDPCKITPEVEKTPGFPEMLKVMKRHGFSSGETYCRTMDRVIRAYNAVQVEEHLPQLQQKLEEVRAQVQADPNLTPEQKEQYLARLTEHPAVVAARKVPEADKQVIAQLRPEIEQMLSEQRQQMQGAEGQAAPGAAPPQ
jgi:hypothetical protein